jgi:hypothetical protein
MNQKLIRIRQILIALVMIAVVEGFSSCTKYEFLPRPVDPSYPWSFSNDIQPVFTANCITCHGGVQSPNLSEGKSYAALSKGGYIKSPGEESRLYLQMISSSHTSRSSDQDKQKVLYWINQGALNN